LTYQEKYFAYLHSPQWRRKVKLVRDRCGGVCERCKVADMVDTHHLTYEHVFDERLHELQGVCRPCHEFVGGRSKVDPLDYGSEI
jgi:hypothetical protein